MKVFGPLLLLSVGLLGIAGCINVADGRAARDETIGRAEASGWRVEVGEGLAPIRALDEGSLELRAGAPSFALTVRETTGTGRTLLVNITNLMPGTTVAGPGVVSTEPSRPTEQRFMLPVGADEEVAVDIAAPGRDDETPWSFAAFGDVQDAVDDVQDIFDRMNDEAGLSFVLMVGDLTEGGGREELQRFLAAQDGLDVPLYCTLGNHELGASAVPYYELYGRGSFRFDHRGVRFVLVDSANATVAPKALRWVDRWTGERSDALTVVGMHIPPLDPVGTRAGSFASHLEANRLLAMLAANDVDLTLYGHIHSYYAFSNAGIPAYITGGGGAIPERLDGIGRHFLRIDVEPDAAGLDTKLVRVD